MGFTFVSSLLACSVERRDDPLWGCDSGKSDCDDSMTDMTSPDLDVAVSDTANSPDIFEVSSSKKSGTITYDDRCEAVLPIDIYTDEPSTFKVYVGNYSPYGGWVQEGGYDGNLLNINTNSYIEVSAETYAFELKGDTKVIEDGAQYLFTYDPYQDQLADDGGRNWSFPFYTVATDESGNASEPQMVTFGTLGINACPSN